MKLLKALKTLANILGICGFEYKHDIRVMMNLISFVYSTDNVDDEVYCSECNSCAEPGCCPPWKCKQVLCKYGEDCVRQYEEACAERTLFYSMLIALGIENPYAISLEQIQELSDRSIDTAGCNVKEVIEELFLPYKEE